MREIKFRAWDKINKAMVNGLVLDFQGNILVTKKRGPDGKYAFKQQEGYDRERFELVQYTGIKDKNGKEIYEGDIVKANSQIGEVIYDRYSFIVTNFYEPSFDNYGDAFSEAEIEVIGNVYENKELIKKHNN